MSSSRTIGLLSADKIIDIILLSGDFESFKKKVYRFGFYPMFKKEAPGGINLFSFDLQKGGEETFSFRKDQWGINASFHSRRKKLKKGLEKKLERLERKGAIRLVADKIEGGENVKKYSMELKKGKNQQLDALITIEFKKKVDSEKFSIFSKIDWS